MKPDPTSKTWTLGKGLCLVSAVTYGIVPPLIDTFDPHHLLNPTWPPHARLHLMWLNATGLYLGIFCLYNFWTATRETFDRLRVGVHVGLLFLAGFFTAGLFKNAAGAAFDADGRLLLGLAPPAIVHLSMSTLLLLAGYYLCRKEIVK